MHVEHRIATSGEANGFGDPNVECGHQGVRGRLAQFKDVVAFGFGAFAMSAHQAPPNVG
jgi:hypothetical protein